MAPDMPGGLTQRPACGPLLRFFFNRICGTLIRSPLPGRAGATAIQYIIDMPDVA
jgi:hypothetical protein